MRTNYRVEPRFSSCNTVHNKLKIAPRGRRDFNLWSSSQDCSFHSPHVRFALRYRLCEPTIVSNHGSHPVTPTTINKNYPEGTG